MRLFVIPAFAAVGAVAAALLLALPSTAARRVPGAADRAACASLARVSSFRGSASISYDGEASGTQPTTQGTLAITTDDGGLVRFTLKPTLRTPDVTIFGGRVTGDVQVDHSYGWTKSDGTPEGSGTAKGSAIGVVHSAFLVVSRSLCQYEVSVGFSAATTFSGDPIVSSPGSVVTIAAQGPRRAIPPSLTFAGGGNIPVHEACDSTDLTPPAAGCFAFSGGWAEDFATLKLCHSTEPVNCAPDTTKLGSAGMTWHLVPVVTRSTK